MDINKLNGWQRLWVILAVIWLIPSAWITFQNFPLEQQVHATAKQAFMDAIHDRREKEKEIADQCESNSDGDVVTLFNCMSFRKGMQGLSWDERKTATERENAMFRKNLQEAQEQRVNTGLKQLLGNQVLVALQGLLIWLIPLMSIYAFGLGIVWIRSGFQK